MSFNRMAPGLRFALLFFCISVLCACGGSDAPASSGAAQQQSPQSVMDGAEIIEQAEQQLEQFTAEAENRLEDAMEQIEETAEELEDEAKKQADELEDDVRNQLRSLGN